MATTDATTHGNVLERIRDTIQRTRVQGRAASNYGAMCRVIAALADTLDRSHQTEDRDSFADWVEFQHRLGPDTITPEDLELAASWLREYQAENKSKPGWFLK